MTGYEKLKADVIKDCGKGCDCFCPEGCNKERPRIGTYGQPGFKACFHRYCDKFKWVIDRAKQYGEKLGVPWAQVLDSWEADRTYWYMNYYQECNQPSIVSERVRVFDTVDDLRAAIGKRASAAPAAEASAPHPMSATAASSEATRRCATGKCTACSRASEKMCLSTAKTGCAEKECLCRLPGSE